VVWCRQILVACCKIEEGEGEKKVAGVQAHDPVKEAIGFVETLLRYRCVGDYYP
jgi:hypothetical protein